MKCNISLTPYTQVCKICETNNRNIPKRVKLVRNPIPFGLIGLDFPGESIYQAASDYHFKWLELFQGINIEEHQVEAASSILAQTNMQVVSVSSLVKLNQAEEELNDQVAFVKKSIKMASELNAPFSSFMYGGNYTLDRHSARDRFLKRMEPLIEEAIKNGVTLLIENVFSRNPPGDLDSAEKTLEIIEQLDSSYVGLMFDPANFAIGGEEAFPFAYNLLKKHIKYIHLKDAVRYVPSWHGPLEGRRELIDFTRGTHISVPLGKGLVNYEGFLTQLTKDGFDGPIALEPFAYGKQCDLWLLESLNYLRSHSFRIRQMPQC